MKLKQVTVILLSAALLISSVLPIGAVGAFASETDDDGTISEEFIVEDDVSDEEDLVAADASETAQEDGAAQGEYGEETDVEEDGDEDTAMEAPSGAMEEASEGKMQEDKEEAAKAVRETADQEENDNVTEAGTNAAVEATEGEVTEEAEPEEDDGRAVSVENDYLYKGMADYYIKNNQVKAEKNLFADSPSKQLYDFGKREGLIENISLWEETADSIANGASVDSLKEDLCCAFLLCLLNDEEQSIPIEGVKQTLIPICMDSEITYLSQAASNILNSSCSERALYFAQCYSSCSLVSEKEGSNATAESAALAVIAKDIGYVLEDLYTKLKNDYTSYSNEERACTFVKSIDMLYAYNSFDSLIALKFVTADGNPVIELIEDAFGKSRDQYADELAVRIQSYDAERKEVFSQSVDLAGVEISVPSENKQAKEIF